MAKPTQNARLCGHPTVIAAIGAAASIYWKQPLAIIIARASRGRLRALPHRGLHDEARLSRRLAVLVAEIVLIVGKIEINIARFVAKTSARCRSSTRSSRPVVIALLASCWCAARRHLYKMARQRTPRRGGRALLHLDPRFCRSFVKPPAGQGRDTSSRRQG